MPKQRLKRLVLWVLLMAISLSFVWPLLFFNQWNDDNNLSNNKIANLIISQTYKLTKQVQLNTTLEKNQIATLSRKSHIHPVIAANCNKDDIYCIHSCGLCNLLIGKNIHYAFIEHDSLGFALISKIQQVIEQFCNCPKNSTIYQRLFKHQINVQHSKRYLGQTLQFNLDEYKNQYVQFNGTNDYLARINNTIWFHFIDKPVSTIMSAFYDHAQLQCSTTKDDAHDDDDDQSWDEGINMSRLKYDQNESKPMWRLSKMYNYLLEHNRAERPLQSDESDLHDDTTANCDHENSSYSRCAFSNDEKNDNDKFEYLDLNQTIKKLILDEYSKDKIGLFFKIIYNGRSSKSYFKPKHNYYYANVYQLGLNISANFEHKQSYISPNANRNGYVKVNADGYGQKDLAKISALKRVQNKNEYHDHSHHHSIKRSHIVKSKLRSQKQQHKENSKKKKLQYGSNSNSNINSNINSNRRSLQLTMIDQRLGKELGLSYLDGHVIIQRDSSLQSCYEKNYFSKFIYNNINIDASDSTKIENISTICDVYGHNHNHNRNHNRNTSDDDFCNMRLFYETIGYAECQWLESFTVRTLSKLLLDHMIYYKLKYHLNMNIVEFEISQWKNDNIDMILDKLNIVNSMKNKYFVKQYFVRQNVSYTFDLAYFRDQLSQQLNLNIGRRLQLQMQLDTEKQSQAQKFLQYNYNVCLLVKNLTIGLYFEWDYHHLC